MKKIEAIIHPFRFDEVKEALVRNGIEAMTVSEVKGSDGQSGQVRMYRGTSYVTDLRPRIKIELVIADDQVLTAVGVLQKAAPVDKVGPEIILVMPIENVVRIRTGEHGEAAIRSASRVVRETPAQPQAHPSLVPATA